MVQTINELMRLCYGRIRPLAGGSAQSAHSTGNFQEPESFPGVAVTAVLGSLALVVAQGAALAPHATTAAGAAGGRPETGVSGAVGYIGWRWRGNWGCWVLLLLDAGLRRRVKCGCCVSLTSAAWALLVGAGATRASKATVWQPTQRFQQDVGRGGLTCAASATVLTTLFVYG
jgi:hypothetical protein